MPEQAAIGAAPRAAVSALLLAALVAPGHSAGIEENLPAFGRPASDAEIAAMPVHVFADGRGLPPGSGDAGQGKKLYDSLCAACHGS